MHRTGPALLVLSGLLALGGCGGGAEAEDASAPAASRPTTPSATGPASPTPVPPTEVDGVWGLKQTKKDVVAQLKKHGFEDITGEFLEAEQVWDVDQWQWTFDRGTFKAQWMQPDGAWKVADSGTYDVDPPSLSLTFGDGGRTTVFRYTVTGDELLLDWQSHDAKGMADVKNIPDEAFWRAYLSQPLTRQS